MGDTERVFEIRCSVQNYAWGKHGSSSAVAQLAASADKNLKIDENKPYAELWMGTHSNGPSEIYKDGQCKGKLKDWIKQNVDCLGSQVREYFNGRLPFLFKVLSVNNSLSIQAHPNKVHSEKLHKERPDIYKDPNHKPEMAIALTPFKAMCGFRPIQEVADFLTKIEPFRTVVGSKNAIKLITASKTNDMPLHREAMKYCFTGLMQQETDVVQRELKKLFMLVDQFNTEGKDASILIPEMLQKLNTEFPGDVGNFAIYFLNIITLKPGEAIFLEADYPHAYLSGDCMECMACSDNVVRAGLTPKFRDVHTLCEMLDYTGRPISRTKLKPSKIDNSQSGIEEIYFTPPIYDFAVNVIEVSSGCTKATLQPLDSASIVMVQSGEGIATNSTLSAPLGVRAGSTLFISANETVNLDIHSQGMLIFRALAGL
ncbi:mannose-6-phosphate isomerase-like [Mytilus californianus]|uniref:mannose-6-phosphate isomerase-like n=1 Tax=Mytilus californianus TaxID=6549 RepID=UPI00224544A2|nr:mannose-6-phosphate isomerase-like [Mytilus californianus]